MEEIERKAIEMGWVPQEQFKGDPAKWRPAEEFVERGESIMPILKKTNEKLRNEMAQLQGAVTQTQQQLNEALLALQEFKKYHDEDSQKQYERALAKLKADRKVAIREQDFDTVDEIEGAIDTLSEEAKNKKTVNVPHVQFSQPDPTANPDFQQWISENKNWYGTDKEKTVFANSIAAYLRTMEPNLVGRPFLDRVAEETATHFGTSKALNKPDRVEGSRGGSSSSSGGSKSYADLPASDKAICDRFGEKLVGPGKAYPDMTAWRKQYAKDYFRE